MFSRPVSSGWKPVPTSSRLATRPLIVMRPVVGSVMRLRILSSVDLAGAVSADDAKAVSLVDLEGDLFERPELVPLEAAAFDMADRMEDALGKALAGLGDHVPEGNILAALTALMSDDIPFPQIFDSNRGGHMISAKARSVFRK